MKPSKDTPQITELDILGKTYEVVYVPRTGMSDDNLGSCEDEAQRICVAQGLKKDLIQDTLLHEITHALDYHLHLNLEERQVSVLATGLIAVFRANSALRKLLLD